MILISGIAVAAYIIAEHRDIKKKQTRKIKQNQTRKKKSTELF